MPARTSGGAVPKDLWRRALDDPALRELPFKVETNEYGQLVLSPHKPRHSIQQSRIAARLRELLAGTAIEHGEAAAEFAVETAGGIKVPGVVWISAERLRELPEDAEASPVMPELAVELLSRGNTRAEMEDKHRLYFAAGARVVWICGTDGRITFYGPDGEIATSVLVPRFPNRVE